MSYLENQIAEAEAQAKKQIDYGKMILNILEPQYVKLYRRIPKWHVRIKKHDDEATLSRFFFKF